MASSYIRPCMRREGERDGRRKTEEGEGRERRGKEGGGRREEEKGEKGRGERERGRIRICIYMYHINFVNTTVLINMKLLQACLF